MIKSLLKYLIFVSILFLSVNSFAQFENPIGTVPPGIKWEQINTDTVRIVFPKGLESQALRLTNLVHTLAKNNMTSIGERLHKIDIFLINTGVVSNGFVTPAPYHSKFFTTAPTYSFAGTVDWLDLLGIHEYRHVMQMNNSLYGITKSGNKYFGDIIWGLLMYSSVPSWFFEGDAVQQETSLSYSGRGRFPLFKSYFLTIMNMKKSFSYEKMRCGSYKNYIPNHYSLGYHMVNFGRKKFGNSIWADVFRGAVEFNGVFWPFSKTLKSKTGYSTKGLYDLLMAQGYMLNNKIEGSSPIYKTKKEKNNPTFYSHPKFVSNNELIVIKNSFDHEPVFVKIDILNDKQKELFPVSYGFSSYDTDGKHLIWTEINKNPRWEYLSYSNIYSYDYNSGAINQLSKNTRYFLPRISPDKKKIAVLEASENMEYSIKILELSTGKVLKSFDNPDNYFFTGLDWMDIDNIVAVANKNNKSGIVQLNIQDFGFKELLEFSHQTYLDLNCANNKLYFSSAKTDKIQTLYCFDIEKQKLFEFKPNVLYAVVNQDVSQDGKIVYCNKEFDNSVVNVEMEKNSFRPVNENKFKERISIILQDSIAELEGGPVLDNIPQKEYEISNYKPFRHLVDFHSWYPIAENNQYSAYIISNDKLDKLSMVLNPVFNANDQSFSFGTYIKYGGWYPIISLGYIPRLNVHSRVDEEVKSYNQIKASISIPLSFIRLNWQKNINCSLEYAIEGNAEAFNPGLKTSVGNRLDFNIYYSNKMKSSYRSIYPKMGIEAMFNFKDLELRNGVNQINGYTQLFLPGFFKNNSFRLRIGFLINRGENFNSEMLSNYYYARGYKIVEFDKMISGLKFDYTFPLLYPDISIGKFAFIKRIRANLYFDIDRFDMMDQKSYFKRSVGLELIFNNVYFRSITIPMGIGFDYLIDNRKEQSPVNFRYILKF